MYIKELIIFQTLQNGILSVPLRNMWVYMFEETNHT